ncbi:MAG: hypothetical protein Q8R12_01600 [bacterium]|nr:hypothetical protein [bacterium]
MQAIRKILVFTFVGLLIVPQITFAAWWNPFDWLKSQNKTVEVLPASTQQTPKKQAQSESENPITTKEKIVEKIVERPVVADLSLIIRRLDAIEARLTVIEQRKPTILVTENTVNSDYDDLKSELNDVRGNLETITSRISDFIWCINNWDTVGEPIMEDDWRHCKNMGGF